MDSSTILTVPVMERSMADNGSEYERLVRRRDELKARLDAIQRDLNGGLERDWEEQSIQLENLEVLEEISRVAQAELRDVEERLTHLKAAS